MTNTSGIELPDAFRDGVYGDRYLGVIPVAQAISIDGTLVILVAIERCSDRSFILCRVPRRQPFELSNLLGGPPWPSLSMTATDDAGTSYRIRGNGGSGNATDYLIEFGMAPAIPVEAQNLDISINELGWADVSSWEISHATKGPWRFTVNLASGVSARPHGDS